MPRKQNRLSVVFCKQQNLQPGLYCDGLGLCLQVSIYRTKSWLFRYSRRGREHKMGLGALHTISLAEARQSALECRKLLQQGVDPIEVKRAQSAKQPTFAECAAQYIEAHSKSWTNAIHAEQWPQTLAAYVYPYFGDLPVDRIETTHVHEALKAIWNEKPETAARVRGRIESVLDFATAHKFRSGDNPARWRGHLRNLLPARKKGPQAHLLAVPFAELPGFLRELRELLGVDARALEYTILTAVRSGECLSARWSEIDLAKRTWTIPGERMKAGREHRVPLSPRAVAILASLPREGGFVFSRKAGKPLDRGAMQRTMKRLGRKETPHGFRSSFRDWASEQTSFPHEVCEMTLAHVTSNKVEAAYRRGDLFEK